MTAGLIGRRTILTGGAGLLLAGCDRIIEQPTARKILFAGEDMQKGLQRALMDRGRWPPNIAATRCRPSSAPTARATRAHPNMPHSPPTGSRTGG
ncbi:hypothetical protein GCM10020258_14330 [Sphingomonas yabuuchiae]